jgi:hypothetical protein
MLSRRMASKNIRTETSDFTENVLRRINKTMCNKKASLYTEIINQRVNQVFA